MEYSANFAIVRASSSLGRGLPSKNVPSVREKAACANLGRGLAPLRAPSSCAAGSARARAVVGLRRPRARQWEAPARDRVRYRSRRSRHCPRVASKAGMTASGSGAAAARAGEARPKCASPHGRRGSARRCRRLQAPFQAPQLTVLLCAHGLAVPAQGRKAPARPPPRPLLSPSSPALPRPAREFEALWSRVAGLCTPRQRMPARRARPTCPPLD